MEGERGLVAVVAVGDEELRVRETRAGIFFDTPEPVAAGGKVRLPQRGLDRIAVVEQEDRLELRPCRPQQPQSPLLRPGVRALVRQDDPVLVRFEPQRDHESVPGPRHPVRARVALRQRPDHRVGLALEHAFGLPLDQLAGGLLFRVRQGEVDDVVRVERQIARALLR